MSVNLYVVQGQPYGKRLTFPPGEFYIGRGRECHVRPNSEWVSRQHCRLRVTPEGAFLWDLGSCNGTLVNGQLLTEEYQLRGGDQVQVGPLVLEVRFDDPALSPRDALEETLTEMDSAPDVGKTPP